MEKVVNDVDDVLDALQLNRRASPGNDQDGDAAYENEPVPAGKETPEQQEAVVLLARAGLLGRILRQSGSVLLVMSALAFLLQRWDHLDHIARYFSFLGFTAIVAAAGVFCGVGIKESKGARTLLGLVAALIPVHFAQLGALIFSRCNAVLDPHQYPFYLAWTAPSAFAAFATVGAGVLTLAPLLFFAFSALDRTQAKRFTVISLLASATLLVPIRDPNLVAVLTAVLMSMLAANDRKISSALRFPTFENRLARAVLFLPVPILLGRQVVLYSVSGGLVAMTFGLLAAFMFYTFPKYTRPTLGDLSQLLSSAPLTVGWACFLSEIGLGLSAGSSLTLPLFGLPLAAMTLYMSVAAPRTAYFLQGFAASVALGTSALGLSMHPGVLSSLVSLTTVVTVFVGAFVFERRSLLVLAAFGGLHALGYHLMKLFAVYDFNLWLTLGIVGLATVVGASFIEKHFTRILAVLRQSKVKVEGWRS